VFAWWFGGELKVLIMLGNKQMAWQRLQITSRSCRAKWKRMGKGL